MPGRLIGIDRGIDRPAAGEEKDCCRSGVAGPGEGAVVVTVHTDRTVYLNSRMSALLNDFTGGPGCLPEFIEKLVRALRLYRSVVCRAPYICQYETVLAGKGGDEIRVEVTASEILWRGEEAFMILVRPITRAGHAGRPMCPL